MPVLNGVASVETTKGLRVSRLEIPGEEFRCALAADLHLSADPDETICGVRPRVLTGQAVAEIAEAGPDLTIVAGDLAYSRGRAGDYRACRRALAPIASPLALAPGNHDHRERLLAVLAQDRDPVDKVVSVVEAGPVRIVVLDSLYRTDVVPGLLGEEQRRWLDRTLRRASDKPTVLVVHHPLAEHDNALFDSDRLLGIVERRRSVQAIVTAHDHAYRARRENDLWRIALPAVGFPFEPVDGKPAETTGWIDARFTAKGVSLKLRATGGQTTRRRRLDWRR